MVLAPSTGAGAGATTFCAVGTDGLGAAAWMSLRIGSVLAETRGGVGTMVFLAPDLERSFLSRAKMHERPVSVN